ncbi:MAG: preprotein translocase subunit SecA [Chloroflexi bacterium]|nr:preprotein translocase subunit SecA [Chloroflexota bacterium]
MVLGILKHLVGDDAERTARQLRPRVAEINALEPETQRLSDRELLGVTDELRAQLASGESLDDLLPEAFAAVREAVRRHTGERQFDVQLMGGMVLHDGDIAEMRTGEGKTSVAALAAYLNALEGRGVHIVTVNDYLAARDAGWYGRALVERLGLTAGVIQHDLPPDDRRAAYAADLTYGTNNEFGFDYLRDNMVHDLAHRVQRGLNYAIVDEVDNILIDEARTPLIISGAAEESTDHYYQFAGLVTRLDAAADFTVDLKLRAVSLTEVGISKMERLLKVDNLYDEKSFQLVHYLEQALRAQVMYTRGKDYVLFANGQVIDGRDRRAEVVIVDEFTGRLMHGRRFSDGLHQAIEAKENVAVQRESQTMATVTFQNYFRMYDKLAGMTGTAKTEEQEFQTIYDLNVRVIPTHREMIRDDAPDLVYASAKARDQAVINGIVASYRERRPVLAGTTSIEKSEELSGMLRREGVVHNVLNAKYHAQEAQIVAEAGRLDAVTIATNMAGRGTDIILGGRPEGRSAAQWQAEHDQVIELGGLQVLGTERHDARRIDNQLRGRSGRQGDPGASQFFVSLEDELMRRFGSDRIQGLMHRLGVEEDQPIESGMVTKALESAQTKVEAHNYETRKYVIEFDNVVNRQRGVIYQQRDRIIKAEDLVEMVGEMLEREVDHLVDAHDISPHTEAEELEELVQSYLAITGGPARGLRADELEGLRADDLREALQARAQEDWRRKIAELPDDAVQPLLRWIMLQNTDYLWVQHLTAIEDVRQGIGLRAYGQQDPLVAFKREGFQMFEQLMTTMQSDILRRVFRAAVQQQLPASTVLSRHREQAAAAAAAAPAARASRANGSGGQAPRLTRRERRRRERDEKKRAKRQARRGKKVRSG